MADGKNRQEINLKASVQTSDNPLTIYGWGDPSAKHVQNTGIIKGGVTNVYLQTQNFTGLDSSREIAVAPNGNNLISIRTASGIRQLYWSSPDTPTFLNYIGNVSSYGILNRIKVGGVSDVMLTADGTYLTLTVSNDGAGNYVFTVSEYSLAQVLLNQRIVGTVAVGTSYTVIQWQFIRYLNPHYVDNQEFFGIAGASALLTFSVLRVEESGGTVTAATWLSSAPAYVATSLCYRFEGGNGYAAQAAGAIVFSLTSAWGSPTAITLVGPGYSFDMLPVVVNGHSAIILTAGNIGVIDTTHVSLMSYYGFDSGGTFHATPVALSIPIAAGTTPTNNSSYFGLGYAEAYYTVTVGGSSTYWAGCPHPSGEAAAAYLTQVAKLSSGTTQSAGYYGFLTGTYLQASSKGFCFRLGYPMTSCVTPSGVKHVTASFISVAAADSLVSGGPSYDTVGSLLTNFGEIDGDFIPQTYGDSTVLYRYNGEFLIVKVDELTSGVSSTVPYFQQISSNIYKINTVGPYNILNVNDNSLYLGSIDYAGASLPINATTGSTYASFLAGTYCTSIDVGQRTVGAWDYNGTNGAPLGARVPSCLAPTAGITPGVDQYVSSVYVSTYFVVGNTVDPTIIVNATEDQKVGLEYVPSLLIPPALGYTYGDRFLTTPDKILLLDWFYTDLYGNQHEADLYVIGNEVTNFTDGFNLFGNTYVFDGDKIWLANLYNNQYTGRQQIAVAQGLVYLTQSPEAAFFLSQFDNSVHVFTGGQSVQHIADFNQIPDITGAVYNVRDRTLNLIASTYLVAIRDGGIVSLSKLDPNQIDFVLWSTQEGISVANNNYVWKYSFNPVGSPDILTLQTAYFGQGGFERHKVFKWHVILSSATKAEATVTLTAYWLGDDDNPSGEQTKTVQIDARDWDGRGQVRLRMQPSNQRSLASSLGVSYNSKLTILEVYATWEDENEGQVKQGLST